MTCTPASIAALSAAVPRECQLQGDDFVGPTLAKPQPFPLFSLAGALIVIFTIYRCRKTQYNFPAERLPMREVEPK
jgi:hypothetical protein